MATIQIATNFNITLEFNTASFQRRFVAWLIDLFIQVFYLVITTRFNKWLSQKVTPDNNNAYNMWAVGLLLMLPFFLYHVVCEITMNGQSIGKKLMCIRVVNENGGRASISQYIIRWLIKTSDYSALIIILYAPYAMVYGMGVYWAIFGSFVLLMVDLFLCMGSKKNQRLGDILAHTLLIKTIQKESIANTVFLDVTDNYQPLFPQVMQLSDKDINAIKDILILTNRSYSYNAAESAAKKLQAHLNIETTLAPIDFLEVLLKDYNYLVTQ